MNERISTSFLIVDDHIRMRKAIIDVLRLASGDFIEAGTGEEAVALYANAATDWVIMDVCMPGQGGLAATSEIVRRHAEARVGILSSDGDEALASQAMASGATFFLPKDELADLAYMVRLFDTLHVYCPDAKTSAKKGGDVWRTLPRGGPN